MMVVAEIPRSVNVIPLKENLRQFHIQHPSLLLGLKGTKTQAHQQVRPNCLVVRGCYGVPFHCVSCGVLSQKVVVGSLNSLERRVQRQTGFVQQCVRLIYWNLEMRSMWPTVEAVEHMKSLMPEKISLRIKPVKAANWLTGSIIAKIHPSTQRSSSESTGGMRAVC